MTETIELLHNFNAKKMQWPAMGQIKLDGVPVRIMRVNATECRAFFRQGDRCHSIPHIINFASKIITTISGSIIGELYIPGVPFKDISGLARRHAAMQGQTDRLRLFVFDADLHSNAKSGWDYRRTAFAQRLAEVCEAEGIAVSDAPCRPVGGSVVHSEAEARALFDMAVQANPKIEGMVFHQLDKPFQPAKRCWGTQRMKTQPTIDLRITGFEQAEDKYGTPLPMVGRLNAEYSRLIHGRLRTTIIGIGPGALTHHERRALWAGRAKYVPKIAEIKYMPDETYDALRQPTFIRWRTDKEVADVSGAE